MKKIVLLTVFIILFSVLFGQDKIRTNIKEGEDVNTILSSGRFFFADYQPAVFFTAKGSGQAKMNYNMLTNEMMFINSGGDTLALSNPKDISVINFGRHKFTYTSKGFLEILAETTSTNTALLVSQRIKPATVKQYGAYGMTTNTAAIDNINHLNSTSDKLIIDKEITYAVTVIYYLQSGKSITLANEKAFVKLFGKNKKEQINAYIKEQNLNLKKKEDIIRLFNFCAQSDE